MAQRWPKDGPKEGRSNPKNLEYILTIHILSTARELCIRKIQVLAVILDSQDLANPDKSYTAGFYS